MVLTVVNQDPERAARQVPGGLAIFIFGSEPGSAMFYSQGNANNTRLGRKLIRLQ